VSALARYLILGNLTIDDTVMPDGRTAMGSAGGNVLYAAVGAKVWTDDLLMVSRLGLGYPEELLADMGACGYRTDGLVPVPLNAIRQWQLYDREGGRNYVRLPSAPPYVDMSPRPEEIPTSLLSSAIACHIAPMPIVIQEGLVHWARSHGLRVILDPHHENMAGTEPLWRRVLPHVDVFLPSQEEAVNLLGGWAGAEAATRELHQWGAGVVVLKLGPEGVLVYDGRKQVYYHVPTATAKPVDTTGCGDAFCGGFLVGWGETGDLLTGAFHGTVSASFVAADFGARHAFAVDPAEARGRLRNLTMRTRKEGVLCSMTGNGDLR